MKHGNGNEPNDPWLDLGRAGIPDRMRKMAILRHSVLGLLLLVAVGSGALVSHQFWHTSSGYQVDPREVACLQGGGTLALAGICEHQ